MNDTVRLDVVICTYDNAPRLAETLQALAAQQVSEAVRWRVQIGRASWRERVL